MFLISTHPLPIQAPYEFQVILVPRPQGTIKNSIPNSLFLLEYTIDIQIHKKFKNWK